MLCVKTGAYEPCSKGDSGRKLGIDQCGKRIQSGFLIRTVRDHLDLHPFGDTERQDTKQTLGVHSAALFLDPDGALEAIGLLNEKCCGSGVETA